MHNGRRLYHLQRIGFEHCILLVKPGDCPAFIIYWSGVFHGAHTWKIPFIQYDCFYSFDENSIMLDSIRLRNVASYDIEGINISNLQAINFIYGANGCGKTTISKFTDKPNDTSYAQCSLNFKGGIEVRRLVYNKDFRDSNFGKGRIDGVFTLGQATKEDIDRIEAWKIELQQRKDEIIKKQDSFDKLEEAKIDEGISFKEVVWHEVYKKNEAEFKEAFRGFLTKEGFKNKLLEEYRTNTTDILTIDELKSKAQTIFDSSLSTMQLLTVVDFKSLIEIEEDRVWGKKIIGRADVEIAGLIQRLNLNDWVNEGRNYLQDDATCPFCQNQTITDRFRRQIEDYFDESFKTDVNEVKRLADDYSRFSKNIENLLVQIETREKDNSESKLDIDSFSALLKTLSSQFTANGELLSSKRKEPSRAITLVSVKEQLINIVKLINDCNAKIKVHNALVSDFDNQRDKLIKAIWRYLCNLHNIVIEEYIKKNDNLEKGLNGLNAKLQTLQKDRQTIESNIRTASKKCN